MHDEAAKCRFIDYIHGLVRELCTNYGPVDILWYDVAQPYVAEGWESVRLNAMVRQLQPNIIINNRSRLPEDFSTPEQPIQAEQPGRDWEACMTLNDNWGPYWADIDWKSTRDVIMMLAECAAGGGNLLLNVGPDPDGLIPVESQRVLRETGAWLQSNGEAIFGTNPMCLGWMNAGKLTAKDNTVYLLIDKWPGRQLHLGRLESRVGDCHYPGIGEPTKAYCILDLYASVSTWQVWGCLLL